MSNEEELAAIEALWTNDDLFTKLETAHGIELSSAHRDEIVETLAEQARFDHMAVAVRKSAPVKKDLLRRTTKYREYLGKLRQAPHGTGEWEAHLACRDELTKLEELLQETEDKLEVKPVRGAPPKDRRALFTNLALIFEHAGATAAASYKQHSDKIDGPFVRSVKEILDACPSAFRERHERGLADAVRAHFRHCRRQDMAIDKMMRDLDWPSLYQRLLPDRVKDHQGTREVCEWEWDVKEMYRVAKNDWDTAAKAGASPKTSGAEIIALGNICRYLRGVTYVRHFLTNLGTPKGAIHFPWH